MHSERIIGIAVVLIGLATYFVLIPNGIVSPSNVESLALAPDFWPKIVAAIFAIMGLGLVVRPTDSDSETTTESNTTFLNRLPRLGVILGALFGFYYAIPQLGMVVPAMLLIFCLMWFAGERRWMLMAVISIVTPIVLYFFFVFVASIPIPLGVFESLRG
ncbi:MAG: tripartite tricarboxylate transporter TctB family protein [bacterium]